MKLFGDVPFGSYDAIGVTCNLASQVAVVGASILTIMSVSVTMSILTDLIMEEMPWKVFSLLMLGILGSCGLATLGISTSLNSLWSPETNPWLPVAWFAITALLLGCCRWGVHQLEPVTTGSAFQLRVLQTLSAAAVSNAVTGCVAIMSQTVELWLYEDLHVLWAIPLLFFGVFMVLIAVLGFWPHNKHLVQTCPREHLFSSQLAVVILAVVLGHTFWDQPFDTDSPLATAGLILSLIATVTSCVGFLILSQNTSKAAPAPEKVTL